VVVRGNIIGGSALLETGIEGRPYPNDVVLSSRTRYVEWRTDELSAAMREDKTVEAAMVSTLYRDVVGGMKAQKRHDEHRLSQQAARSREEDYLVMLRMAVADGLVHPRERQVLDQYAAKVGMTEREQEAFLSKVGWTVQEWEEGVQADVKKLRRNLTAYQANDMRKAAIRALGKRTERTNSLGAAGALKSAEEPAPTTTDYVHVAAELRADPGPASAGGAEHDERRPPPVAQPAASAAPAEPAGERP
jgi:hypothetical protein